MWPVKNRSFPMVQLRPGEDGFWYFVVEFIFPTTCPNAYMFAKFGVKQEGGKFLVRHDELVHEIHGGNDSEHTTFCDYWYDYTTNVLSNAVTEPTRRMGFHPGW